MNSERDLEKLDEMAAELGSALAIGPLLPWVVEYARDGMLFGSVLYATSARKLYENWGHHWQMEHFQINGLLQEDYPL